ncbi:MAG: pseudouridine synthase [Burkholderiaceae bacterium]|nr:pseudouridine synthase [Burkholderiaceae bacterium]
MVRGVSASAVACPAGPWGSVLDFLSERLPLVARADWHARLDRGDVLDAQGQPLAPDAPYRHSTRLYYYRQLEHEPEIPFQAEVLFRDDWLVVADKPHFLPVTPKGRYVQQTLLTRLKRELDLPDLTPVHRLDRETAGLTVFAVQPGCRDAYQRLFRDREVRKLYQAIAPYRPDLNFPIERSSRLQERADAFMQMEEVAGPANAQTRIALLERQGALARYELQPHSGQKHQLRMHMCALGLPIVGDRIYPVLQAEQREPDYRDSLQLLAQTLCFEDPVSGQRREFHTRLKLEFPAEI